MSEYIYIRGQRIEIKPDTYYPCSVVNRVRRPNSQRYVAADKECNRLMQRIEELKEKVVELEYVKRLITGNVPIGMLDVEDKQRIKELEARLETIHDPVESIKQWCEAYPLDIFPEPDLKLAHKTLKQAGLTLDAISASAMRHVLKGITRYIDQIEAALNEKGEGDERHT